MNLRAKRRLVLFVFALALAACALPAASALAKKTSTTRSKTVGLANAQSLTASAKCPGGSHVTGGGFKINPPHTPSLGTGVRTFGQTSHTAGKKTWTATGSAAAAPLGAGRFTTYARCEKNSLGKVVSILSGSAGLAPKSGQASVFHCPRGSHVLSGGYFTDTPFNPADAGLAVVQSQRTSAQTWTIAGYNSSALATVSFGGYASCELNGKGKSLSTRSASAPLVNDGRTEAKAKCPKRKHVVSGGFAITPLFAPNSSTAVPSVAVDVSKPAGKGWQVGLYENLAFVLPPGSALLAQAYCKKG